MGDYPNAIRDFDKVIELEPTKAEAHYNLGLAYYELGVYKIALESFDSAVELEPQDGQSQALRDQVRSLLDDDMASPQAIDLVTDPELDRSPFDPSVERKVKILKALC